MTREEKKLEFYDLVKDTIATYIPEAEIDDIQIVHNLKNNDTEHTAVVIKEANTNITPTIYLDQMAEEYADGRNPHELMEKIANVYQINRKPNLDISFIQDFENVKHHITTKIISSKLNQKLLAHTPHETVGDMAAILRIQIDEECLRDGSASITVKQELLDVWGVSFEKAMSYAVENDILYKKPILRPVEEILLQMHAVREQVSDAQFLPENKAVDFPMYLLTTSDKIDGANIMCHPELLDETAAFLDSSFVIITSSVHECIIVPYDKETDLELFRKMIIEVNQNELSPEEVLNDHPFVYDKDERQLYYEMDGEKRFVDLTVFSQEHAKEKQSEVEKGAFKEGIGAKLKAGQEKAKAENTGKAVTKQNQTVLE